MKRLIAFLLLAAIAPACTKVVVKRASDDATPGLRYYLPQSFLVVTPNEDGSMSARVESLADRSQRYAVTAQSYMATHDFIMKLNQGLLTEVTLTSDTSAVAADAIKAAGEVGKSRIEAQIEADKAAREKKEEEAKEAQKKQDALDEERRQDRRKLDQAINEAKVEREKAVAARDALPENAEEKDKQAAEVAFKSADAKVKELERQRTELGSFSVVGRTESPTTSTGFALTSRPGPVILRIAEDPRARGVLQLVPISFDGPGGEPQKIFPAYTGVKATAEPPKKAPPEKIEFEKSAISLQVQNEDVPTTIQTKIALASLQVGTFRSASGLKTKWKPEVKEENSKTWKLTFKAQTPPDVYTLTFLGRVDKDATQDISGELTVTITP